MPVFDDVSWPPSGRWVRTNILMDAHGNVTGPDSTSASLTRGRDRELLRQLRAEADAVIVGGASVRAEGWFFPPHGDIVVVSRSGNLPNAVVAHPDRVHVVSSIDELTPSLGALNAVHIVCEAGPRLLNELISRYIVDEAFVSVVFDGESKTRAEVRTIVETALPGLSAFDLNEYTVDPGILFSRFVRRRVIPHGADSAR